MVRILVTAALLLGSAVPAFAQAQTPAQKAFAEANARMHAGMAAIPADPDVAFMQGMLAHHQGAVDMSRVALRYAGDPEVRALAEKIIAAQEGEIAQMRAWLAARGIAPATQDAPHGHH